MGYLSFLCEISEKASLTLFTWAGLLFRVMIKQELDGYSTLYLLESMGKVYLVCSSAHGMQVLQVFEQSEAEQLLSDQNFGINDLLPKDSKI